MIFTDQCTFKVTCYIFLFIFIYKSALKRRIDTIIGHLIRHTIIGHLDTIIGHLTRSIYTQPGNYDPLWTEGDDED